MKVQDIDDDFKQHVDHDNEVTSWNIVGENSSGKDFQNKGIHRCNTVWFKNKSGNDIAYVDFPLDSVLVLMEQPL